MPCTETLAACFMLHHGVVMIMLTLPALPSGFDSYDSHTDTCISLPACCCLQTAAQHTLLVGVDMLMFHIMACMRVTWVFHC